MAQRVIKRSKQAEGMDDDELHPASQKRRPELGRFTLQVDRQIKASYETREAAETAGRAIKTNFPVVQVAIYDNVENVSTILE